MEVLLETSPQALGPPSISPKAEKGLRFHPTCEPISHPVMVSQIPAKDRRHLNQRRKDSCSGQ